MRPPSAGDEPAVERLADSDVMSLYAHIARRGFGATWLSATRNLSLPDGFARWTVELLDWTFVGQCGPLRQQIDNKREVEIVCFFDRGFWRAGTRSSRVCGQRNSV